MYFWYVNQPIVTFILFLFYLDISRLIEISPTMHFWNSSQNTVNATRDLASDKEDQILQHVKWILVLMSDSFHHEKLLFTKVQSNIMWKLLQSCSQYLSDCLEIWVNSFPYKVLACLWIQRFSSRQCPKCYEPDCRISM